MSTYAEAQPVHVPMKEVEPILYNITCVGGEHTLLSCAAALWESSSTCLDVAGVECSTGITIEYSL